MLQTTVAPLPRWSVLAAAFVGCLLFLHGAHPSAAAPIRAPAGQAVAARSCPPPKYPGVGYFTTVSTNGASCATANKLVLAYYRCRLKSGKAGRCRERVLGFHCIETRNSIPTEIDARVSCRKGSAKVVHTYQQDL